MLNLEFYNPYIKNCVRYSYGYNLIFKKASKLFKIPDMRDEFFVMTTTYVQKFKERIFDKQEATPDLMPFLHILIYLITYNPPTKSRDFIVL